MSEHVYGEGDKCPFCGGELGFEPVDDCQCHISPPCGACVDNPLVCLECFEVPEDVEFKKWKYEVDRLAVHYGWGDSFVDETSKDDWREMFKDGLSPDEAMTEAIRD